MRHQPRATRLPIEESIDFQGAYHTFHDSFERVRQLFEGGRIGGVLYTTRQIGTNLKLYHTLGSPADLQRAYEDYAVSSVAFSLYEVFVSESPEEAPISNQAHPHVATVYCLASNEPPTDVHTAA